MATWATFIIFVSYIIYQCHSQVTLEGLKGSWGQYCALGVDDPLPSVCESAANSISVNEGKIECSANFDCCPCQQMICGVYGDDNQNCDELNCNGDWGCYGVRDIQVYGSSDSGALISCNGDESCNGTRIIGENIKEIVCSGDGACARASFSFNCLEDEPCPLECGGDRSCAGQPEQSDPNYLTSNFIIGVIQYLYINI